MTVEIGDAGFASVAGERPLGRIKVLLVRMTADLLKGEDLKKTSAGNLLTVFGEPDIEISHPHEDCVVVTLTGRRLRTPPRGRSGPTTPARSRCG